MKCCDKLKMYLYTDGKTEWENSILYYDEKFDEYGIIIHDGGKSYILINYCPWCGTKFPDSKRELWFDLLEGLGYDDPINQNIPDDFRSALWYNHEKYDKRLKTYK